MRTLTQLEYLDTNMVLKGVVDWLVKESPMAGILPAKEISGNAYQYNVSLTLPTASWLTVGDQISESTGTHEQRTTNIYTLLTEGYTDKSKIQQMKEQNPELVDIQSASEAMAHEWEKQFIIGQTSVDSSTKQPKGLLRMIAEFESSSTTDLDGQLYTSPETGNNTQVLTQNATSGALTMDAMDTLIDQIKPGKPDLLLMSRFARRKLNKLQRASGGGSGAGLVMIESALFGKFMTSFDEIPIYVSDWVKDNYQNNSSSVLSIASYDFDTTRTTDYDNTIIFAMKIGENGVQQLHSGQMTHEREEYLEDYNAVANRFTMYCGFCCTAKYSLACLTGVEPSS